MSKNKPFKKIILTVSFEDYKRFYDKDNCEYPEKFVITGYYPKGQTQSACGHSIKVTMPVELNVTMKID